MKPSFDVGTEVENQIGGKPLSGQLTIVCFQLSPMQHPVAPSQAFCKRLLMLDMNQEVILVIAITQIYVLILRCSFVISLLLYKRYNIIKHIIVKRFRMRFSHSLLLIEADKWTRISP